MSSRQARSNENMEEKLKSKIQTLIQEYFSVPKDGFIPGETKIPLNVSSYGSEEVWEAIESMLSSWVTMGRKVKQFETNLAEYLDVKYAVMVNSGSSANLLAMSALASPLLGSRIKSGDEVIVPAVAWSTTVFPIISVQAIPIFVDVDLSTYNIGVRELEKAITKKTKAIVVVHIAGNPCEMDDILEIAKRKNLLVVEDACEALGAGIDGKKVGGFSDLATFSFFFTHQITTIEGGAIVTDNDEYADVLRSLRAHGWIRDMTTREKIAKEHKNINSEFLFYSLGYNFRPTELQGAFGLHQLEKLDGFIEARRKNADYWLDRLMTYARYLVVPAEREGTRHAWFSYPLLVREDAPFRKEEMRAFLESRLIETRPVIAGGNLAEQPAMRSAPHRIVGDLPNAKNVMRNSLMIGNHQGIGKREGEYVADCIGEFVRSTI